MRNLVEHGQISGSSENTVSPDALALTRNKFRCRERLAQMGIAQPAHRLASTLEEVAAAACALGWPAVIKPVDGSASVNVAVAADVDEAVECGARILAQEGYGLSARAARQVLVEEHMAGELVSCESLSAGGRHLVLGLTDRLLTPAPHRVELGGCFPAPVPERDAVAELCVRALEAIGYDLGAAHVEVLLTSDGPRIVEINGRLTGFVMPLVLGAALRRQLYVDLVELYARCELPALGPPARRVAAIRSIVAREPGKLVAIEPSPMRGAPGVVDYDVWARVGDRVRPPRHNRERCGCVITVGPDAAAAGSLAARVADGTGLIVDREVPAA